MGFVFEYPGWELQFCQCLFQGFLAEFVVGNVVGRAQLPDIDQAETLVSNRFGDQISQGFFEGGGAGHETGPIDRHGAANIEGVFQLAIRGGRCQSALRGGHRMFAAGHPVIEVVEYQCGHADIAPGGVEQVPATDPAAPIADQYDHF